ncbi:isoprenylcysteine carboxylmethyltransferase family protein [Nocardia sp. CDC159]|uniref:Isoprenylcysteine carboxylmethyltransferase family protein n=1 Tax=Nocardia pulmonis TaxID=2951408 RepID=A0A9X2EGZ1_9NOCA|nr:MULTISPECIES: isoprenylcysteine carboxylmethyltransferase family protein [Nocardia]MCM6778548.1 isoprenylcysteine carboxylmethyltransferase family protein [Nocardia pulmonis]MCM6791437.1 isoprenylcysteine carboxylmethyltransferase family protein [Nocardia sp. CDC159]
MVTTVVALVLFVVWLVVAFGVRILIAVRRTGETGIRPPARFSTQWWGERCFHLVAVLAFAGTAADLTGFLPRIAPLDHPALRLIGAIIAVCGIAATLACQLAMGNSWRIGVDEHERTPLVTTGIFAVIRNPIFAAVLLTALGLTLMVPNPLSLTGLVLLTATVELLVRAVEEPYLRRAHGAAYLHYAARVGRFLPYIGRLQS